MKYRSKWKRLSTNIQYISAGAKSKGKLKKKDNVSIQGSMKIPGENSNIKIFSSFSLQIFLFFL